MKIKDQKDFFVFILDFGKIKKEVKTKKVRNKDKKILEIELNIIGDFSYRLYGKFQNINKENIKDMFLAEQYGSAKDLLEELFNDDVLGVYVTRFNDK